MRPINYPALRAEIGDWVYYIASLPMEAAATYFKFAEEIQPDPELDSLLQRELSDRSSAISEYIKNTPSRFLGALIVATYGGNPGFHPIEIKGAELLSIESNKIGILRFDGAEKYYVLDGQHRLAAIKTAIAANPQLGREEIAVLFINHTSDALGIERARRLFTTLNRYASKTRKPDNIALDEDDGYAILTRRLLKENIILRKRVRVLEHNSKGVRRIAAGESLNKTDSDVLAKLATIYDCSRALLGRHKIADLQQIQRRPSAEVLEDCYSVLTKRWNTLIAGIPMLLGTTSPSGEIIYDRNGKNGGLVIIRPVGLKSFCIAAGIAFDQGISDEAICKAALRYPDLDSVLWNGLLWNKVKKTVEHGKERNYVATTIFQLIMGLPIDKSELSRKWQSFVDPAETKTHEFPL